MVLQKGVIQRLQNWLGIDWDKSKIQDKQMQKTDFLINWGVHLNKTVMTLSASALFNPTELGTQGQVSITSSVTPHIKHIHYYYYIELNKTRFQRLIFKFRTT